MNPAYKKSLRNMDKIDKRLVCGNFNGEVSIYHLDGSKFKLKNVMVKNDSVNGFEMLCVWTEHCGNFVFFKEDLKKWLYKGN